ncbi:MAG: hypothetical protein II998_07270 [Clostridia bacterium]|nr:hypothetical protein [Clostridia bacterium]
MKKTMKKLLASILALAMVLTLAPLASFAEEAVEETVDTSFVFGSSYGSYNNTKVPVYDLGGLGGKAADDTAMAFVYEGEEATADVTRWYYPVTHLDETVYKSSGTGPSVHFAFNIYADGGAIARFSYNNSYNLLLWQPDGTVNYTDDGVAKTITMERGKWHRVAVALNNNGGGRFALYIDGVKLAEKADAGWNANIDAKLNLAFGIELGSTKGTVAYDDPMVGFAQTNDEKYNKTVAPDDVAKAESTSLISIDTTAKTLVAKTLFTDYTEFMMAVCESFTNESEVLFYNADMSASATSLEEAKTVVVKTINGAYEYYTVDEYELTPIDIIGLKKTADDTTIADDNWKGNVQIVGNEKVAVYSSTFRNLSCVSSERLIEALESTNGFTLSYVNENKEPAVSDSVNKGFVKATKEGVDDIYVEIVDKYNYVSYGDLSAFTLDKRGATPTNATGVAGKAADDVSYGFAASVHTWKDAKYYHSVEDVISVNPEGTRTYVFNMYTEGDAIARIAMMYGTSAYYVAKWDGATGDFYGPKGPSTNTSQGTSMSATPDLNLATGRWHQVAITMDKGTGGRMEMYVDGVLLQRVIDENLGWNNYSGVGFGVGYDESTGKVLFDDIEIYNGFYDKDASAVAHKTSSKDFAIDCANKVIYYQNMTSASELSAAVLANTTASSAKVYTDATLTAEAAELTADTVVWVKSPDGLRDEYYTLKAYSELPEPVVSITPSVSTFTVKTNFASIAEDYVCYVATYDEAGKLVTITTLPMTEDMVFNTYSKKLAYGAGGVSAKVFLWKNSIAPVAYAEAEAPVPAE